MREGMGKSSRSKDARLGTSTHHRRWVLVFFLWMAFVWGHSLVQGPASSLESSRVAAILAPLLNALGITGESAVTFAVRKTAHFLEYAVLGALGVPAFIRPAREGIVPRWLGPLVVALVPVADETIQRFVPGRESSPRDVLIDLCGAVVGTLVMGLVLRHKSSKHAAGGPSRP
ncbi:MAG: VanZ family protein [Olsenella sp.]|jgi:VanZ family protein|nr:VanZ family protein [Olsenella sp.]MCI2156121.1 VanZ family protein [Olsenella sp.]